MQLSGARPLSCNQRYFIPTHRFPPTLGEDAAACQLKRKLDDTHDISRRLRHLSTHQVIERELKSGAGTLIEG
jgi:hypothetical protein